MPVAVITTERLLLRASAPEDFEPLFAGIFSDDQVMRHLSGTPMNRDRAVKLFTDVFDHEGTGRKVGVLTERAGGEIVGYAGLMPCTALEADDLELGFVLRKEVWGRGYATEIGKAPLDYGFRTAAKPRLLAQVRPANQASIHALQKIGLTFVKEYERPERGTWHIFCQTREAS